MQPAPSPFEPLHPAASFSAVLTRIERAVRSADGFRCCVIRCDDSDARDRAVSQLRRRLPGRRLLHLDPAPPIESLDAALREHCPTGPTPAILSLVGISPPADLSQVSAAASSVVLLWLSSDAPGIPASAVYHLEALDGRVSGEAPPEKLTPLPSLETLSDDRKRLEIARRRERLDAGEPAERAALAYQIGLLSSALADWSRAAAALELSAALYQRSEDPARRAAALLYLGVVRQAQGRTDDARNLFRLAAGHGEAAVEAEARYRLALLEPDPAAAAAALERCLELRRADDGPGTAAALHLLANLRRRAGNLEEARALAVEAVDLRREGCRAALAGSLTLLGAIEEQRGAWDGAFAAFAAALDLRPPDSRDAAVLLGRLGGLHRLHGDLRSAFQHYSASWHTLDRLEDPAAAEMLAALRRLREQAGDADTRAWVEADLKPLAFALDRALAGADRKSEPGGAGRCRKG